jgi:hypothetical protein
MQKIGNVLKNFNPSEDKYISREFQAYGVHLSETLDDHKHKSLYIKLAKTVNRSILEKALSFASDSKADNKGALFMWKLKQLKEEAKKKGIMIENASVQTKRKVLITKSNK